VLIEVVLLLGQVCGLAKMHLVYFHAAFRVSTLPKYAMSGPHGVATLERIPSQKPRRNQDALYETTGPIIDDEGLRSPGRENPSPHRRP
tara:strand:+ start:162 stop:428 length:267 start_codon:yes stop_codon:yes gene_type:complete